MKAYHVYMHQDSTIPLDPASNRPGARIEYFDGEEEAIRYAKSIRKRWHRVTVHKTGQKDELVSFKGDYMYVGKEKTKLEEYE